MELNGSFTSPPCKSVRCRPGVHGKMSLFGGQSGGGSIWSQSGLFFDASNKVVDLLAKPDFTLDELLDEDELLQEVKQENEQLVE